MAEKRKGIEVAEQERGDCSNVKVRGNKEREMTTELKKREWERIRGEIREGINGRTSVMELS
jgi:hypothetical protein